MNNERIIVSVASDILELMPEFLMNRSSDISRIHENLNKGDYRAIADIGHKLKGSGSMYGLGRISEWGKMIEQAAIEKNMFQLKQSCAELAEYLVKVNIVGAEKNKEP
jgi:HPt (histidine-containing phosphotransfer) domain-containing protein